MTMARKGDILEVIDSKKEVTVSHHAGFTLAILSGTLLTETKHRILLGIHLIQRLTRLKN